MTRSVLAGIDVGAKELVVAVDCGKGPRTGTFANDASGHRKLIGALTRRGAQAQVCVEATGIYHLEPALALAAPSTARCVRKMTTSFASISRGWRLS